MSDIILQASLALFAAALTASFAVLTYYQQREHELIIERYLEGGIDLLAGELQRVITIFNHNWARCLSMIAAFRDLEADFDVAELQRGFHDLESSNPHVVAHHRLFRLVGTHEYWMAYQAAIAFFAAANTVLVNQIPDVLRVKLTTDKISSPFAEVAEEAFEEARKQQNLSHKYVELLTALQDLSSALESKRFKFKNLGDFRNTTQAKETIARLNRVFGEELRIKVAAVQQATADDAPSGRV